MSRLTDLLQRHATHHQPIDLRLLAAVIRQERYTGQLTLHYRNGQPKLLETGKPIVVEVEPTDPPVATLADDLRLTKAGIRQTLSD
jgi:hypothetical protein